MTVVDAVRGAARDPAQSGLSALRRPAWTIARLIGTRRGARARGITIRLAVPCPQTTKLLTSSASCTPPAGQAGAPVATRTGPVQPAAMRRVMRAGLCMALLAAGAILRFTVGSDSHHGLNVHAAGLTVIGTGEMGLLSLVVWGPLNPAWRRRRRLRSRAASPAAKRPRGPRTDTAASPRG